VPLRIMIALLYLKHAFNESDEGVVERWGETPTWQFFSGQAYFEHHRPCDATTLVKFRQLLGEEGVEELRVIVDSTVQHKAIAHPTDSRLLETARAKLVEAAKDAGIDLKQTFAKEGKELGPQGRWSLAEKSALVRRTYEPGLSVSLVVRQEGVAASLLFQWRKLER
jgi:IS5 family transposase